jgi:uncharacterized damage-inducible protein DinB
MDKETIELLFEYNSWANHRTVESCAAASNEQFLQQAGGSFGSLRNTLSHIMDVEWLYHERWQGRSPAGFPRAEDYPNLTSVRTRWQTVETDLNRYVKKLSAQDINRVIEFRNTKGILYKHPLWETMQHLVNHSTYHRGQITTLLRIVGSQPQATDMLAFYRERSGQPIS